MIQIIIYNIILLYCKILHLLLYMGWPLKHLFLKSCNEKQLFKLLKLEKFY